MEMFSKNFNEISKGVSSAILAFLVIIAISLLIASVPNIFAQYQTGPYEMNASIKQVIGITLSNNLTQGIFFTNTTTIGTQIPIEYMLGWNNATANYLGASYTTEYYVTAASYNLLPVKVCHCACDDLRCKNSTQCGNYVIYVNGTGTAEGVGWVNGTTNNPGNSPSYRFNKPDDFQIVNASLPANANLYLRYWLDPYPNNTPSGPYNTTYIFKAVDYNQDCGVCNC